MGVGLVPPFLRATAMFQSAKPDREAFWRKLIDRHATSRLSVDELCRQAGVSTASFYAWRRRLRSARNTKAKPSLVPVRIVADCGGADDHGAGDHGAPITVELVETSTHAPAVRVSIPRGCDEESIRRVLRAVLRAHEGAVSCC